MRKTASETGHFIFEMQISENSKICSFREGYQLDCSPNHGFVVRTVKVFSNGLSLNSFLRDLLKYIYFTRIVGSSIDIFVSFCFHAEFCF